MKAIVSLAVVLAWSTATRPICVHSIFSPQRAAVYGPHFPTFLRFPKLRGGSSGTATSLSATSLSAEKALDVALLGDDPKAGDFVSVSGLKTAGFLDSVDSKRLYWRPEAVELWNVLNAKPIAMHVEGPPGTGKSVHVWSWAKRQAVRHGKTVLWVHLEAQLDPVRVRMQGQVLETSSVAIADLDSILRSATNDIVVLDGCRYSEADHEKLIPSLMKRDPPADAMKILVSSQAGPRSYYSFEEIGTVFFQMPPWTFDQYEAACTDSNFFESVEPKLRYPVEANASMIDLTISEPELEDTAMVAASVLSVKEKRRALLEQKFYYAGVCARWMFAYTYKQLEREIRYHLARAYSLPQLRRNWNGWRSDVSSNHLVVRFGNAVDPLASYFVSDYVAEELMGKYGEEGILEAYELASAHRNPAFLGSVNKYDFDCKLQSASIHPNRYRRVVSLTDLQNSQLEHWVVPGFSSFDSTMRSDGPEFERFKRNLLSGVWMKPRYWMQLCYDLVRLAHLPDGDWQLVVCQITRGDTHSLDLGYVKSLASLINKMIQKFSAIEIRAIVPMQFDNSYKMTQLSVTGTGKLKGFLDLRTGQHWNKGKESSLVRHFGFVPSKLVDLR